MVLCSAAGIEKPAMSAPYQRRAASSAASVSVPLKLTRWASPPMPALSCEETPRAPKSCSLKGSSAAGSSVDFSKASAITCLQAQE